MNDNAPPLRTLTLDEAAAFFQVHKSTVRERAKAGVIPGAKAGRAWRFLESDLIDFMRRDYAHGGATCLSTNSPAAKSGGQRSRIPATSGYASRLENMIAPKLYAELPAHMKPMAEFALETGLRQANVLNLTWARIDLDRKVVWVEAEDAKGAEGIAVPLSTGAINVLKGQQGQHEEFVFTYHGRPIKEIKTAFIAACVRSGCGNISAEGRYTGFTWHGLRHTWATWHVQNGTPLDVLQKLGAWKDERMVQNYAHHSPGYLAQFANNAGGKKT